MLRKYLQVTKQLSFSMLTDTASATLLARSANAGGLDLRNTPPCNAFYLVSMFWLGSWTKCWTSFHRVATKTLVERCVCPRVQWKPVSFFSVEKTSRLQHQEWVAPNGDSGKDFHFTAQRCLSTQKYLLFNFFSFVFVFVFVFVCVCMFVCVRVLGNTGVFCDTMAKELAWGSKAEIDWIGWEPCWGRCHSCSVWDGVHKSRSSSNDQGSSDTLRSPFIFRH